MEPLTTLFQSSPLVVGVAIFIIGLLIGSFLSAVIYRIFLMQSPSNQKNNDAQQLLSTTQKMSKSAEVTTQTVQKIKSINSSLVEITKEQYKSISQVFSEGQHIKDSLSESVKKADNSLLVLHETMSKMQTEFNLFEESIHLFDIIRESTKSLGNVAHYTKILALNTAVIGGRLGKEGKSINVVANEMQELVKICEEASKHIDSVVNSAQDNVQTIVKTNREHMGASLENTLQVEQALQSLTTLFKGNENTETNNQEPSVNSIITTVGVIEQLANEITEIVEKTKLTTENLNNEVEVSNQAVSDLIGIVTNSPIINLSSVEAHKELSAYQIIDVRRPDEFNDKLGHIVNAKLYTLNETSFNQQLASLDKNSQYLFVCRSGGRSSKAARIAQTLEFPHIYNLEGGMLAWNC